MKKTITKMEARDLLAKATDWQTNNTENAKEGEVNPYLYELLNSVIEGSNKTAFEDMKEKIEKEVPNESSSIWGKVLIGTTIVAGAVGAWFYYNKE